jgi:GNAT superfamily N-acetyltransferase
MSGRAVVETLAGAAVASAIPDLARLRITVFRDFPYLYDGDLDYERKYLRKFADLPESTLVVARDGDTIVGASTALPMAKAEDDIAAPFRARQLDPAQYYYFGESVLLSAYRGQGIGVAFFERREARARELGFRHATFCAVDRPATHARRPKEYVPLDAFWTHRGYVKHPDLVCTFEWKEVDAADETAKTMTFWVKAL